MDIAKVEASLIELTDELEDLEEALASAIGKLESEGVNMSEEELAENRNERHYCANRKREVMDEIAWLSDELAEMEFAELWPGSRY